MNNNFSVYPEMSLYSIAGERKYLTATERKRFYKALSVLSEPKERSFAEVIFWTGCRPCEALSMTFNQILIDDGFVIIRSAKKRGKLKGTHFRPIPLPQRFIERLEHTHSISDQQQNPETASNRIWSFSRTTGWRLINKVMTEAGISGIHACARGLRHSMGVHAIMSEIPVTRLQKWLGHASLSTTSIYVNVIGYEDRNLAKRMWG
ncbi:MAG: tyrosine-type recombinase/integrase [Cohaesibacteraceae bacterium]|nr:tyrosine-type recombinase/integrase [Cohaesibacteraceae bacterium]